MLPMLQVLRAYRDTLERAGPEEARPYRVFLWHERRNSGFTFTGEFLDRVAELLSQVDYQAIDGAPLHPSVRQAVQQVRENGIRAPYNCHHWLERVATFYKLWPVQELRRPIAPIKRADHTLITDIVSP